VSHPSWGDPVLSGDGTLKSQVRDLLRGEDREELRGNIVTLLLRSTYYYTCGVCQYYFCISFDDGAYLQLFPDDDRMGIASPSESLPCDRPIVQHFSCPGGCAINEIKGRNHPPLEDENLDGGLLANNRAGSLPLTRSRSAYRLSSRIARSECNSLQMVLTPCNFGLRDFATAGIVRLCRRSHPAVIRNIPPITPCS